MRKDKTARRLRTAAVWACLAAAVLVPRRASAQGFISVSYGYNFGGDTGCRSATDCRNKNWNWGGSLGSLGSVVGFETELTHEADFTGERTNPTSVTTLMGDFMLAPRFSIVQPYGLIGFGAIKTKVEGPGNTEDSQTHAGWTIGAGVAVFVQKHIGLKGDVRYYHSFQKIDLLGIGIDLGQNKLDFGRAALGVLFRF
ncbi:MAG TPA: outer membrane beta-barrel protein [Vicinamibacterales bacterium]|jgi:opacity protein-like surface antigen|nr:outer membrane beta-barrel protein [Vicinamibacterales bacterium]